MYRRLKHRTNPHQLNPFLRRRLVLISDPSNLHWPFRLFRVPLRPKKNRRGALCAARRRLRLPFRHRRIRMPSKTPKQRRTMAAAAHDPAFARKMNIPQQVAREFNRVDQRQNVQRRPQGRKR